MVGTQGRFRRSACAYNLLQSSLPLGPARRWPPSNQPYHPPLGGGCIRRLPCTFPPDRVAPMLKPYHSTGGVRYGLRGVFGMAWFRFLKRRKKKKKKSLWKEKMSAQLVWAFRSTKQPYEAGAIPGGGRDEVWLEPWYRSIRDAASGKSRLSAHVQAALVSRVPWGRMAGRWQGQEAWRRGLRLSGGGGSWRGRMVWGRMPPDARHGPK